MVTVLNTRQKSRLCKTEFRQKDIVAHVALAMCHGSQCAKLGFSRNDQSRYYPSEIRTPYACLSCVIGAGNYAVLLGASFQNNLKFKTKI